VDRRPIAARSFRWPTRLALALVRAGITPNQVSASSVLFALVGAASFVGAGMRQDAASIGLFVLGAVSVQLRLVANLIDGLMAVEGGAKSPVGDLYNDVPDRIADSLFLIGLGYAAELGAARGGLPFGEPLGYLAALLAALTAYVRFVGGALLGTQDFGGPFAKQHRMFAVTVAALLAAAEQALAMPPRVLVLALAVVTLGALVTAARRLGGIARALREGKRRPAASSDQPEGAR
jgi:phosphatidylglycerophosphate synthase